MSVIAVNVKCSLQSQQVTLSSGKTCNEKYNCMIRLISIKTVNKTNCLCLYCIINKIYRSAEAIHFRKYLCSREVIHLTDIFFNCIKLMHIMVCFTRKWNEILTYLRNVLFRLVLWKMKLNVLLKSNKCSNNMRWTLFWNCVSDRWNVKDDKTAPLQTQTTKPHTHTRHFWQYHKSKAPYSPPLHFKYNNSFIYFK